MKFKTIQLLTGIFTSLAVSGAMAATAADTTASAAPQPATTAAPHQPSQAGEGEAAGSGVKLKKGAKTYRDNCSICHGDNGSANTRARGGMRPPPRDFTTIEAALELTRERMIESVTNGRPGTGMMPHKDRLSKQEIEEVVDFIRTSFMRNPDAENVTVKNIAGRKVYTKNCSVCHGDKGNTALWARSGLNPPPRDFTSSKARQELTRDRMITSVTNGRPGTGMQPFRTKLSKQEIEQVVDYIREAFLQAGGGQAGAVAAGPAGGPRMLPQDANHARMRAQAGGASPMPRPDPHRNMPRRDPHGGPHGAGMPAVPASLPAAIVDADMSLPMPGGLKGDIAAGRQFFMSNCFTCHGVTGEGDGPRASFNTPRPRNFTTEESRRILNRVRLFDSITNGKVGTVMPAWSKVLTPQQIANVAEFVFQEFIQAKPQVGGKPKAKSKAPAASEKKKAS